MPFGLSRSIIIFPPCSWAIRWLDGQTQTRTMVFRREKGSNMRFMFSSVMPGPLSSTRTKTKFLSLFNPSLTFAVAIQDLKSVQKSNSPEFGLYPSRIHVELGIFGRQISARPLSSYCAGPNCIWLSHRGAFQSRFHEKRLAQGTTFVFA